MKTHNLLFLTLASLVFISCKDNAEPKIDLTAARKAIVSCYPFDGNANDSKGLNNGRVVGATLTEDRFGNVESAFNFDGNDRIEISTKQLINSEFSWSTWVKPTTLPRSNNVQILIGLGGQGGDQSFAINNDYFTDTKGEARWILGNYIGLENVGPFETVDERIVEGRWYHLTAVRTKDNLAVYLNGVLRSKIYSGGISPYYGQNVNIGRIGARYTNSQNFVGVLDDIMFFNEALTEEEVRGVYLSDSCELE